MRISIPLALAAFLPLFAQATTVLKCVDADGNVNFTQTACPAGQQLESVNELSAPPPLSGDGDPVKMAEPKASPPPAAEAPAPSAQRPIIIVAPEPAPVPETQGSISESYRGYQRHIPYRQDYYPPPGYWGKPPGSWPPPPPPRPPAEPQKPRIKGMPMDR
ncbi:DUF4124 domain-containing protein [Pseudomonas sp.]|uniref:DUF4124 domain-containing protein n=1 Tax=Pseudomonas sp. TaxID=306 RepID=UPI0028A8BFB4|nr:DUF4124 domain-containing protein [Pseudomonas sp.]